MTVKLNKWGNSIGLRLPAKVVEALQLHKGSEVQVRVQDSTLVITPVPEPLSLEWLCEGMEVGGQEENFAVPVGRERFWDDEPKSS